MTNYLTLYARREPARRLFPDAGPLPPTARDVQFYADAEALEPRGRVPWHYTRSKPDRRNRYYTLNCYRYRLVWLPDLA